MENYMEGRQRQIQEYREILEPLMAYKAWFEKNSGKAGSRTYQGQGIGKNSVAFPVYDPTLINFIKEAETTALMNRNYSYVYTRHRIRSHDDERKVIAAAELRDWDVLCGILSKYVLGGRTRPTLWSEAVEENIFALVLGRMRSIIEFWDKSGDRGTQF